MADMMEFPKTWEEFEEFYGFKDSDEVYTNGSRLIQSFRVKQWLDHINKTTQMIDKSNYDEKQYKADLQSAYDCGYNKAMSVIEDIKAEIDELDFDFGDFFDHTYTILEMIDEIFDKHISGKEDVGNSDKYKAESEDNATNGDMIKAMFPNGSYGTNGDYVHVFGVGGNGVLVFTSEWWNAPYKGGKE